MTYHLAIDIGASSGRHILGSVQDGKLVLEEVFRFPNGMKADADGTLCWDVEALFASILAGLKKCAELGKIPATVGIDTWGVDFVLVDKAGKTVGKTVGYRDGRTAGAYDVIDKIIPPAELYKETGLARQPFNTICQLVAVKRQHPEWLKQADKLLMMADYFQFRLTGKRVSDYTNGSTTQLVSCHTREWDWGVIEKLGLPRRLFLPLSQPGVKVGAFSKAVAREVGFTADVVLPPTHDTAAAVAAVPGEGPDVLYISSGTWSLIGTELAKANNTEDARAKNWTNEGGVFGTFRFLKNIMGLWMIQCVKAEFGAKGEKKSFAEIAALSEKSACRSIVDCDDARFFAPKSMCEALRAWCAEHGQAVPGTLGDYAAVVYRSLARRYADAVSEIEALTGRTYPAINIVGGGSQNLYLNRLTAEATGKTVWAGPAEGTAIGNLLIQMIAAGEFKNLAAARVAVRDSFGVQRFEHL